MHVIIIQTGALQTMKLMMTSEEFHTCTESYRWLNSCSTVLLQRI